MTETNYMIKKRTNNRHDRNQRIQKNSFKTHKSGQRTYDISTLNKRNKNNRRHFYCTNFKQNFKYFQKI